MSAGLEKTDNMAYAGDVPWHGMGFAVSDKLSPEQMLKAAKLDWTVSKRKLVVEGTKIEIPNRRILVRDDNQLPLSIVGTGWHETQNAEAADFFKKWVAAGHMNMETMGSLWNSRYMWALARVNKDFKLGKDDEVRSYLLFVNPHVMGKARQILFTSVRVVCWNTMTAALNAGDNGNAFRIPHTQKFDDTAREAAEQSLGIAKHQMDEFKEVALLLTKKKATEKATESFFCEVLKFDPKDAVKKKAKAKTDEEEAREPRLLPKFRLALTQSPGATMPSATGTWWGALNAVTYVVDHELGRDRSTALKSAWLGSKARLKRRALDLAVAAAK